MTWKGGVNARLKPVAQTMMSTSCCLPLESRRPVELIVSISSWVVVTLDFTRASR